MNAILEPNSAPPERAWQDSPGAAEPVREVVLVDEAEVGGGVGEGLAVENAGARGLEAPGQHLLVRRQTERSCEGAGGGRGCVAFGRRDPGQRRAVEEESGVLGRGRVQLARASHAACRAAP